MNDPAVIDGEVFPLARDIQTVSSIHTVGIGRRAQGDKTGAAPNLKGDRHTLSNSYSMLDSQAGIGATETVINADINADQDETAPGYRLFRLCKGERQHDFNRRLNEGSFF